MLRKRQPLKKRKSRNAVAKWQPRFSCVFELVRGGFDVLAGVAGALDDGGDEVDPVLREVVAVVPGGIAINAAGVLHQLVRPTASS